MIKTSMLAVLALSSAIAMASSAFADCGSRKSGTVRFYNDVKGFGFIKEPSTGAEYSFHKSGLLDNVRTGDEVCFDIQDGRKGVSAVNISVSST